MLDEVETPYQYARVVRAARRHAAARAQRGPGGALDLAAGHVPDRRLLGRLPRAAVRRRARRRRGGSRSSATRAGRPRGPTATTSPRRAIDAVEIDGELSGSGAAGSDMRRAAAARSHTADARPFLRRASDGSYDAIFIDAYRQPYIPFYLATREFFELAQDRLAPGRQRGGERRASGALVEARAGDLDDDGVGVPHGRPRPDRRHELAGAGHRRRGERGSAARSGAAPADRPDARSPMRARRGFRRGCAAARCGPTTARRSSGSSTARSCRWRRRGARPSRAASACPPPAPAPGTPCRRARAR